MVCKKGACQSVAGNCECDGPEEKDEIHDFVFVIDGSGLVPTAGRGRHTMITIWYRRRVPKIGICGCKILKTQSSYRTLKFQKVAVT